MIVKIMIVTCSVQKSKKTSLCLCGEDDVRRKVMMIIMNGNPSVKMANTKKHCVYVVSL